MTDLSPRPRMARKLLTIAFVGGLVALSIVAIRR